MLKKYFSRQLLAWILLAVSPLVGAAPVDLTTTTGFSTACANAPPSANDLQTNEQRQLFVICRDVKLTQNIITFATNGMKRFSDKPPSAEVISSTLRSQLALVLNELRSAREVLEKTKLNKHEGILLAPGQWNIDLDGDGQTKIWESFFFAIPKRSLQPLRFQMPSDSPAYYVNEYQLDAKVHIDQSDILWALSYHYFAESLVEILLSYQLKDTAFNGQSVELYDAPGMVRALQLLTKGLQTSEAMRLSVLAETTDENEWIANPKQKHTVFPMPLDKQDFEIWGAMLKQAIPLFKGETLLVGNKKSAGIFGSVAKLCPANTGVSVPAFFENPPRYPMDLLSGKVDLSHLCKPVDKKHPASAILALIESYGNNAVVNTGAGMGYLRRLFWVN